MNNISESRQLSMRYIAPCLLAIIVDGMGFGLVYPIMTAIFTSQDSLVSTNASVELRHFYLGLGYMLYPLCMFFGASFMGDLSDNIGRKKVIALCMFGIFVSFMLMALSVLVGSVTLLMLGRALSGLMAGSQPIAQAAISDISTPESKALNMSVMTLALSFAIVMGPLIGGVFSDNQLSSYFTFSTPFFIAAALALISFLWIVFAFKETYINYSAKPINIFRPITIFQEAFAHKAVRLLSCVFLLMQLGFSLYFQFILVLLKTNYAYANWQLGAFNGFIGFSFAFSLLIGMRLMLKVMKVNQVAMVGLFLVGVCQIATALIDQQLAIWLIAFPLSAFDMIAYTAILTAYSNTVDKSAQGWVMGISGAIMAVSWAITGLCANLLPLLGADGLILGGGILLLLSAACMWLFNRKHI